MVITVGGLLITSGIVTGVITLAGTAFGVFAAGMSDNPSERFSWKWPGICAAVSAAMILAGVFGGL
jgi:hypothetical protein